MGRYRHCADPRIPAQFPERSRGDLDARQGLEREPAAPAAAIRDLVSGLLISGRTSPELGGLMLGCGIT